jgi:hypothetical protein
LFEEDGNDENERMKLKRKRNRRAMDHSYGQLFFARFRSRNISWRACCHAISGIPPMTVAQAIPV